MFRYESLEKLHFKGKNVDEEYKKRFDNECSYNTELKIYPILRGERVTKEQYSLFYLPINEINLSQEKIFLNSKKIIELNSELPNAARFACINDIMTNEITKTNGIEGVHSTKREIYESMSQKKVTRYSGIINKYTQIITNNIETIDSPEQIRKIYDDIFSDDILKSPENQLDGVLFRKDKINISNGVNNIHSGDPSEEIIMEHINDLIKFMNKKDIPTLIKASIVHYYFEYIHPFYDGNGRFGRFLLSSYLARKIDIYTGLSLSYSIFEDKKKYADLFFDTSKVKNYGEMTFFIIGMLNFIIKGQESIIKMLQDKMLRLNYAEKYIEELKTTYNLSEIECNILFIYVQNYIFAKENPLPDKELLKYVNNIKSINTLRRHLNNLTDLSLLNLVKNKPYIRIISNTIKEVLD
ncbi:Fic family protein [Cetobacterium somerae]|uniref:Fic family protein n=1 Tax=Cetobacterium somerae TaxID=188913 RepID=UPI00211DFA07|nr:Fic family protein [Cetobacterium somerae]MCQ9626596.1 Fic family protein [Cetobacterium somerae]